MIGKCNFVKFTNFALFYKLYRVYYIIVEFFSTRPYFLCWGGVFILCTEEISMENVIVIKDENGLQVCFYIQNDKPFNIGKKMKKINKNAYMNGYNWEAFLNYYLAKNAPDILNGMTTDPEAGLYAAYYDVTAENEARAENFAKIINTLLENEEEIYCIVREEGKDIAWD